MPFKVAASANAQLFIASPACVHAMNNIWYDKIRPDQDNQLHLFRFFWAIVSFGLLAPISLEYRKNEKVKIFLFQLLVINLI